MIFEVVTDLAQPNPTLNKKEVRPDKTTVLLFSGSKTLVLEPPSPAAGSIFVLWQYNFITGTAVSGGRLDFGCLVVQL